MDNILFKKGDRVFHIFKGWGTVDRTQAPICPSPVIFDKDIQSGIYYAEVKLLSFTEYNLEKGGFSQDRDLALIGKWCQIWDNGEKAKVRIAKVQAILQELDYPYQAEGVGWANAKPLDEETIDFLIQKGIIPNGDDTRDNSNS